MIIFYTCVVYVCILYLITCEGNRDRENQGMEGGGGWPGKGMVVKGEKAKEGKGRGKSGGFGDKYSSWPGDKFNLELSKAPFVIKDAPIPLPSLHRNNLIATFLLRHCIRIGNKRDSTFKMKAVEIETEEKEILTVFYLQICDLFISG